MSGDTKKKMQYDDLTYTQIIDPTLGGNLPKPQKEKEEKKSDSPRKTDDLTYTQIIDPTLGGNLPKKNSKIEKASKESAEEKVLEYDDLTYTQMLNPVIGANSPSNRINNLNKEVSSKNEEVKDTKSGFSLIIGLILVLALVIVGIIIAAKLAG